MKERDNDAEKKRDRSMWIITVLAGMASYLDAGLIVSIGISLALWETHYQATALVIGSVSAVSTACIAIGALIGGRLADIFGRTRVFSITVFMYSVGVFCIVFAESISFLFVGIIISGISAGADLPTSLSIISERAPKGKQGKFIAFTQVMWSVGILGVTAIGFAVASLGVYGLKILWLHLAVLGTLTWLLRCFYKPIREIEKQLPVEKEPDNASGLNSCAE
ncbi:MFS transporter [Erwinia mallotivora]|uniref:MFS transporter n=1 Tax=Erwinia mallotivora TaxID=69222 RepID=UPI00068EF0D1|nr:MFS transporter [Erwinia mallotivora]